MNTNFDYIKEMDKKKLAKFISDMVRNSQNCSNCPAKNECKSILEKSPLRYLNCYDSCALLLEEWLVMKKKGESD